MRVVLDYNIEEREQQHSEWVQAGNQSGSYVSVLAYLKFVHVLACVSQLDLKTNQIRKSMFKAVSSTWPTSIRLTSKQHNGESSTWPTSTQPNSKQHNNATQMSSYDSQKCLKLHSCFNDCILFYILFSS